MNPSIVRYILYPSYRFLRRDDVSSKLKELEKNQWLSRNELKELQWTRLKRLLDYAYKHVHYYTQLFNELGLKPEDIKDPGDFHKIPVLDKEIIRKHKNNLISSDPARKGFATNTGGSTGEPLYFYKDLGVAPYRKAHIIRINRYCGLDIGDKEAVFWGTPFDVNRINKVTHMFKQYMQNILFFSTFDMSEKSMMKYAGTIRRFKPKMIRGYPSALFTFTKFLKKNNINDIKPHAIVSTGEKSFTFQKELMEDFFGCSVYERYGSNEFGCVAHECSEHHGMHIFDDMYYVEFLKDNRVVEKGESGEIVVTDLHNYYMPFIRYRIGDTGVYSDAQCSCGRGYSMIEEVKGRSFDMIVTPSGKALGGFFWTFISRAVPGIKQFQIVQRDMKSVDFKIVPDSDFVLESTKKLEREINQKTGGDLKINFKIIDEIPLTPSGKLRFIISDLSKERLVMKSKIHKAVVNEAHLDRDDCVIVDEELMKMVNLKEFEKVLIVDNTNGARVETFIRKGKKGSGLVSVNGASAHQIKDGDEIIIMAFTWTSRAVVPKVILVNEENKFVDFLVGGEF